MKKILLYLFAIVLGASIPIYFLLIWEPLKSDDVISENVTIESKNNYINVNSSTDNSLKIDNIKFKQDNDSNSIFNYLDKESQEKLNNIIKDMSILDYVKINDFFSDKDNTEKVKYGIELAKKRLSLSQYEEFKNILEKCIDLSILN